MMYKILEHLEDELEAAEDYIDSAFEKRSHCPDTANLFISIAMEEIQHAERLLKQGQILCDKYHIENQENQEGQIATMSATSYGSEVHKPHMRHIWHWEKDKANEEIAELRMRIQEFKRANM